jgi:uncharacterized phage protein (TIGR01671 family)
MENEMREIKFRAWKTQCQCNCIWSWERLQKIRYGKPENNIFNDPDYILMQYTGLKDKNGKEIYEGDILKHVGSVCAGTGICKVTFNTCAHFVMNEVKDGYEFYIDGKDEEVIGNIYENPELLKKS